MEKGQRAFRDLPFEKRQRILQAALAEFSGRDYKAANTDTIAARAGISKGALFYYFRNKQSLYFTLVRYAGTLIERALQLQPAPEGADFFAYIDELVGQKAAALAQMPELVRFSVRAYYSGSAQVSPALDRFLLRYTDKLFEKYFAGVDVGRFRPGCTPRQALDLLLYLTDGYIHTRLMEGEQLDMAALMEQYRLWQRMVRQFVYKEDAQ